MSVSFSIDVDEWEEGGSCEPLEACTFARISMRCADVTLTEVNDRLARTTRSSIRASAYPLALWLASNWWRILWESRTEDELEWSLAHRMGSAGRGYVWPDVELSGDGQMVTIHARRRQPRHWEPIAYLGDCRSEVTSDEFEAAASRFVTMVLDRLDQFGHGESDLRRCWSDVLAGRTPGDHCDRRRLEALLGFDPGEAPEDLLKSYQGAAEQFGSFAVAEIAAQQRRHHDPGADWDELTRRLEDGIPARLTSFETLRDRTQNAHDPSVLRLPWERGKAAARAVRAEHGLTSGPLSDEALCAWLSVDTSVLTASTPTAPGRFTVAGREHCDSADLMLDLRSPYSEGRRFELGRLMADHLVASSPEDRVLPATRTHTSRQRVQRAFSAELLAPLADLSARLRDGDDDDVRAMAEEYGVSPVLVLTTLVNEGLLDRSRLYIRS